jgi:hypothetical protein
MRRRGKRTGASGGVGDECDEIIEWFWVSLSQNEQRLRKTWMKGGARETRRSSSGSANYACFLIFALQTLRLVLSIADIPAAAPSFCSHFSPPSPRLDQFVPSPSFPHSQGARRDVELTEHAIIQWVSPTAKSRSPRKTAPSSSTPSLPPPLCPIPSHLRPYQG